MTEYLRRLKTKLQFSHQDSKNDEPFFDANDVNWNTKVLTHSQWAHTILGSNLRRYTQMRRGGNDILLISVTEAPGTGLLSL